MPEFQRDQDGVITHQRCIEPDCREMKPITEFSRDRTRKSGRSPRCKKCQVKRVRAWRRENPLKVKKQNLRAMAKYGDDWPKKKLDNWKKAPFRKWALRFRNLLRYRGFDVSGLKTANIVSLCSGAENCRVCGAYLDWPEECDEIADLAPKLMPLYNDRPPTPETLWVVCSRCFASKGNMSLQQWVKFCGRVHKALGDWAEKTR